MSWAPKQTLGCLRLRLRVHSPPHAAGACSCLLQPAVKLSGGAPGHMREPRASARATQHARSAPLAQPGLSATHFQRMLPAVMLPPLLSMILWAKPSNSGAKKRTTWPGWAPG